jgi:hypothetical protein
MSLDLSGNLVKFPDTDGDLTNLGRHRAEGIEHRVKTVEGGIQNSGETGIFVSCPWSVVR